MIFSAQSLDNLFLKFCETNYKNAVNLPQCTYRHNFCHDTEPLNKSASGIEKTMTLLIAPLVDMHLKSAVKCTQSNAF